MNLGRLSFLGLLLLVYHNNDNEDKEENDSTTYTATDSTSAIRASAVERSIKVVLAVSSTILGSRITVTD